MINREIFREYDIRGLVDKDLDPAKVEELGRAFGTYMDQKGMVEAVVGFDNRLTSGEYAERLIRGLMATGRKVINIGLVITPIFYFAEEFLGIRAGAMVTASHNPKEYNGFKMSAGPGTLHGDEIQEVFKILAAGEFVEGEGSEEKREVIEDYIAMLKEKIVLPKPLKVVLDCGNGTAGLFAPRIFREWGCGVVEMYCESDGSFPNHIPDPVKMENLKLLAKRVLAEKADLGIGLDGDGDRIGVVDDKGEPIFGDMMMVLFFEEVLKNNPGMDCIIEVKCSRALPEMVEKLGGKPIFYKTGHSLIKAKMRELGTKFAGEMSGHMFFADEYYGYDDAIYAAGRLTRIISQSGKSLSELLASVPKYYSTPEVRVATTEAKKFEAVEKLVNDFKNDYEVVDVDGARVIFPEGWGLIRASNTQPVLVVRAEASSQAALEEIKKVLEGKLKEIAQIKAIDWSGREE